MAAPEGSPIPKNQFHTDPLYGSGLELWMFLAVVFVVPIMVSLVMLRFRKFDRLWVRSIIAGLVGPVLLLVMGVTKLFSGSPSLEYASYRLAGMTFHDWVSFGILFLIGWFISFLFQYQLGSRSPENEVSKQSNE